MFFDQMRSGGCSQVLSVAPEYRNYGKSHPGRDDDCREHGNRPGRDDDCREHGNRPGRDNDCREHGNGGSNCGKGCNAEEDCCKSGVTAILEIAIQALSRDETVGVEITLEGGYTQVVTLGRGTQTFVSSDLLSTPLGVVSLCEVTRLRILSDSAADPDYMQRLSDALERFAGGNRRRSEGGCSEDGCDSCVEAIQRYIMRNADDIEALLYDGSQAATASAVTGTTTAEALSSASISSTEGSFLTSAVLETETAGAVTSVTTADTGLVTAVEASPATVVTAVTAAAAEVSAPVTFTPVEVLGEVTVTDEAEFVSGLTVTPASVSGALTTETLTVVSGFTAPVTVSGVISGVTAVSAVTTSATDVPVLVGTGTGPLQVVVPANAFGAGIPETAVTLPVTVGGATLTFGGNITAYTFASASTLLGDVAGAPVVTDISTPAFPRLPTCSPPLPPKK